MPAWLLATAVPAAVRSYFTAAWVAEVSVTESTLDETAEASGLAANDVTAEVNSEPFCSRVIRLLFGVAELKKASQLALICAMAAAEPPLAAGLALEAGAGAEVDAGAEDDADVLGAVAAVEDEELEPLLEQADIAVASTRPSAGAR